MQCSPRGTCAPGLCDLHTVIESGALSHSFVIPSSEDRLGFRICISCGATALGKWPEIGLNSLLPPNTENNSSFQGSALLPTWSLNMHGLILPPAKHLRLFQRGTENLCEGEAGTGTPSRGGSLCPR